MRKFCDFFGVEEAEILMPHREFSELIVLRPRAPARSVSFQRIPKSVERALESNIDSLRKYSGYYYVYYNSMSNPGKILRAIAVIYEFGGGMNFKSIEILPESNGEKYTCKYDGVCALLSDRIFITSFETLTRNEITHTVLYPSYTNKINILVGVLLGVSHRPSRDPCASRLAYQRLGSDVNLRKCMDRIGLFDYSSADVPEEIKELISMPSTHEQHLLTAPRKWQPQ